MAEENKNPEKQEDPAPKTYTEEQYQALETKVQSLTDQLAEANKTIKSYTDMDIDGIKQSAADWEQKAKQAEADRAAFEHRTRMPLHRTSPSRQLHRPPARRRRLWTALQRRSMQRIRVLHPRIERSNA